MIQNFAGFNFAGRALHQSHNGQAGHRFTTAGFTHNGQGLALVQIKIYAINGRHNAILCIKVGFQVMYLQ